MRNYLLIYVKSVTRINEERDSLVKTRQTITLAFIHKTRVKSLGKDRKLNLIYFIGKFNYDSDIIFDIFLHEI